MPQLKAIIEYGKVINIFVHEGGTLTLPEGQMYVNVGDQGVNIGWTYDYVTGLFSGDNGLTMAQRVGKTEAALSESQAENKSLTTQIVDAQLALCDIYELMLGGDL